MAKRLFQQSLSDHCVGRSLSFGKVVAYSPRGSLSHKRICLLYSVVKELWRKLPNITPHSFRHTYCTNMANRGMNPNTLQYLMGHANITMTLGYYAHGTFQSAKAELERLAC